MNISLQAQLFYLKSANEEKQKMEKQNKITTTTICVNQNEKK